MKCKLLLFFLLACELVAFGQIGLFTARLRPATPELEQELTQYSAATEQLSQRIEELRHHAYRTAAPYDAKVDLAAFLVHKIIIQHNLPYEANENLIFEAADLLPGDFIIESTWGDLLYMAGNYGDALYHYETAHYENPDDLTTLGKAAMAAQKSMNYDKALRYFEQINQISPNNFHIIISMGVCRYELKDYYEAVSQWEHALDLASNDADRNVAMDLLRRGREMLATTGDGSTDVSQKFVIHYAGDSQRDLGDVTFDLLEEIFFQVTDSLRFYPDVRINVLFFLTEDYYKINKEWSAGAAQGIRIMIPLKSGYKSQDYIRGLLAHEFTHTLVNLRTNNRCPVWLNEGLAQYQEFMASYGDPTTIRPDFESIYRRDYVESQNIVRINQVTRNLRSSAREDIVKAYITSYLAVRYLAEYYGEQSFDEILTSLGQGDSINEALNKATGRELDEFEEQLVRWMGNLR